MGIEASPDTPEAFRALIASGTGKWSKVVKDGDIKPE